MRMFQRIPQFDPLILYRRSTTPDVGPTRISETDYWENYYEDSDHHYEWNDGYLEEKGVSEKLTTESYEWFFELLRNYLRVTGNGQLMALETGFRLVLPGKTTIRKPDLGVILKQNPVPWQDQDHSYQGICDLCVEALSDSTKAEMERDTDTKFKEYARAGVKEYYILYAYGAPQEFYRRTPQGVYLPLPRRDRDIISSMVLPGFQFRVSDLQRQPSPEEMSEDQVYQGFMLPALQAMKALAQQEREARQVAEIHAQQEREARHVAEAHAQQEQEARQVAEAYAQQEREARQATEAKLRQLEAELARFRQLQKTASS